MIKKLLLSNTFILISFAAFSQGIRFNTFCWSNDFKSKVDEESATNFMSDWFLGIGYEQNVGDRMSVSLCFNSSLGKVFGSEDGNYREFQYPDPLDPFGSNLYYSYYYTSVISYTELSYQSKYFFSDNDDNSGYISSGIGLKFVKWTFDASEISEIPAGLILPYPSDLLEEKLTVVPLSLKLGSRGSMDGFFSEYYIGFTYNLGADKLPQDDALKNFTADSEKPMNKLAFTLGYSFGIGWAD